MGLSLRQTPTADLGPTPPETPDVGAQGEALLGLVKTLSQTDASTLDTLKLIGTTKFIPLKNVKNILITGGAGFIGSWVTRHLTVQYPGYNIVCIDKLDIVSSLANIEPLNALPNFTFVKGDICDGPLIRDLLTNHNIDCVMHFAASSHVQNSFSDGATFTINNVVGTQTLLEAMRDHGKIARFIHVSTDEVYGETNGDFVDETKQFLPTNPYSASKAAAEMYVHAYSKSFNIPTIIVRSNNVYGPCQFPEKIIPTFFNLLSEQKPIKIQGSGLHSRRYLYGGDAADGFDTVLHKGVIGDAYNVGSSYELTNMEVAIRMLEHFGLDPATQFKDKLQWGPDRPFNDADYRVDGTKLRSLGWSQATPFDNGLNNTVKWYRRHLHDWWDSVKPEQKKEIRAAAANQGVVVEPITDGSVNLPSAAEIKVE